MGGDGLIFHSDREKYKLASGEALADLIARCAQAECVLLNACDSKEQALAIHQHVNYVIGMNRSIGDRTAIEFSSGFYEALWAGKSYIDAYEIGRNAIDFENKAQSSVPEMMVREFSMPELASSLEAPYSPVRIRSPFYVERPPVEEDCYKALEKPSSLVRLNAARQMGKSSLMFRIQKHGREKDYYCISINFRQADFEVFESSERFLRWFCAITAEEANIDISIDEAIDTVWKTKSLANKRKCTNFFEKYLLKRIGKPLLLCLDEVDLVLEHQKVYQDFFSMIRAWHENGGTKEIWQNLRLAIAHSREVYPTLKMNESPFNVGIPIKLPELSTCQVEGLARKHGLRLSKEDLSSLMRMVGGHPYLVRVALYKLVREQSSLSQFIKLAPTEEGPYEDHLRRHLASIKEDEELAVALRNIVSSDEPIEVDSNEAFQLASMGLLKRRGNAVEPLCDLYRQYFKERLQ